VPAPAAPTASDNCDGDVTIVLAETSTQTAEDACTDQNYTITRTWTASDNCGNASSQTQTITVQDTTAPVITYCPASATVECELGSDYTALAGVATAVDNCDANVEITFTDAGAGSCPEVVTRTWRATDSCGNFTECTQVLTVQDTLKPELTGCPEDVVIKPCEEIPAPALVTALDGCAGPLAVTMTEQVITNVLHDSSSSGSDDSSGDGGSASGDSPSEKIGESHNVAIIRTWEATDACGHKASCTQVITINNQANCVYSQGYWKNHPESWPATTLTVGCASYSQAELLGILGTSPKGDATYILAHQVIAALLNVQMGACASPEAEACLADAQGLLCTYPVGSGPTDKAVRNQLTDAAKCLDYFNNAKMGTRKCSGNAPNHPPVAIDDMETGYIDTPVNIAVLSNDMDADGDGLGILYVSDPGSGTVVVNPTGTITYTPNAGFWGDDAFSYVVTDGRGGAASAIVMVYVEPTAPPPGWGDCTELVGTTLARSKVHFAGDGSGEYAEFEGGIVQTLGNLASDFRNESGAAKGSVKVTLGTTVVYENAAIFYEVSGADAVDNKEKWEFKAGSREKVTFQWKETQNYDANRDPALPVTLGKLYSRFIHAEETEFRLDFSDKKTELPLTVVVDGVVLATVQADKTVVSALPHTVKKDKYVDVTYPARLLPGNTIEWYRDGDAGDGLQNYVYQHEATSNGSAVDTYFNAGGRFWITVPALGVAQTDAPQTAQVELSIGEANVTLVGCGDFEVPAYEVESKDWTFKDECR